MRALPAISSSFQEMTMTTHLAEEIEAAWSTAFLAPARLFGKSNA
jgi:hypothetical protein